MVCDVIDSIVNSDNKRRAFVARRPREVCRDVEMCERPSVPSESSLVSTCIIESPDLSFLVVSIGVCFI